MSSFLIYFLRHWGKWEKHVHQTDEDHPRRRLHRRGQKGLHQTGLSEHLHSHAGNDPSHGNAQDPLQIWAQQGKLDSVLHKHLSWNKDWLIIPEKDAATRPRRRRIFLEPCLSYAEQPSIIASCALFTLPVSLQHTSPPSRICVCTYNRTAEANFDRVFWNFHFSRSSLFSFYFPLVSPRSRSFGSCTNDLLLAVHSLREWQMEGSGA